jgi:hypothetical protein
MFDDLSLEELEAKKAELARQVGVLEAERAEIAKEKRRRLTLLQQQQIDDEIKALEARKEKMNAGQP